MTLLTANKIAKAVISLIFTISLVFAIQVSAEYLTNRFIYKIDRWIEYESVEPVRKTFAIDEPIVLVSNTIVRRVSQLTFVDRLICDEIIYSQTKGGPLKTKIHPLAEVSWRYNGDVPRYPAICHTSSFVTATVGPFTAMQVHHTMKVESSEFQILGTLFDE